MLLFVSWNSSSLLLFFPWFLTMHHLQFPSLSCSQCNESEFDNCLLHQDSTRQNHLNPQLISKVTEQDQTASFFLVLSHGTGIPYKCYSLLCCLGDQELCWDSLAHKSDIAKLHQDFLTQLVLHENLSLTMPPQLHTRFSAQTYPLLCLAEVFVDNQASLKP